MDSNDHKELTKSSSPAPAQEGEMRAEQMVEIRNPDGLHMRPAMQFVERANTFASQITIYKESLSVDGKSIMQVTMLAATHGTKLRILAEGPDAVEAAGVLAEILQQTP